MYFREARVSDIKQLQWVRNEVKENQLSDPQLITDEAVAEFIINRGKGWVCEIGEKVVGFSIVDLEDNNIWALFVHPEFESRGIGKQLLETMLDWYFSRTSKTLWLSTAPHTRAEVFYRLRGWQETGVYGKGEIRFEMSFDSWNLKKNE